jgi:hypothetical protein
MESFRHILQPAAAVEFMDRGHHRLTLRLRAGKLDRFPQQFLRNIYRGFHASKISLFGFRSSPLRIPESLDLRNLQE